MRIPSARPGWSWSSCRSTPAPGARRWRRDRSPRPSAARRGNRRTAACPTGRPGCRAARLRRAARRSGSGNGASQPGRAGRKRRSWQGRSRGDGGGRRLLPRGRGLAGLGRRQIQGTLVAAGGKQPAEGQRGYNA
ncbi:Uncharacterised protein [Bordetella pertussis]|nr:Uncharacterised protein [Bordetella pertussis]